MPELPDVEGFCEVLNECGSGQYVRRVDVRDTGVLRGVSAQRLRREVEGRRLGRSWRHGKLLIVPVADGAVIVWHFGMTGELVCARADEPPIAHDRVLLTLDDERQLRYRDQRKLLGIRLAPDQRALARLLDRLGPDALEMTREDFLDLLAERRGAVKGVLMDQSLIAGLGNLLSDEILWRARVAPRRPARALDDREARNVFTAMRGVLATATRAGCVPPRQTWLTGHRDDGEPACPRCGRGLQSRRVAGRRTVWCEHCQH
ncbi:Fpg/Nei family DNA glycosylase [Streptomyces luteolifulvus]|uniref:Fpg/Nei family DNA glycosylase n=1 Tax=Streptomyces luteolifulvus TaxID=2615112 RepID=A0A6H9UUL0_9ACTN|nr:DNA-formamidopyrimidine glycosylase family protein [Streptomyces luteolifulvus]KAB1143538.1 Fpg/Nei family DNA glycosylase [Streptomyces luteolifulvus]